MTRALAWGACALTVLIAVVRIALAIVDPESSSSASGPTVPGGGVAMAVFEAIVLMALGVIGAVVASRQPRNAVGWILCLIPLSLGVLILGSHVYWSIALEHPEGSDVAQFVAWLSSWIWIPAMVPALTLFPLLFPSGRLLTPRWRPVAWMAIAACPTVFVGQAFAPGRFEDYPIENPLGAEGSLADPVQVIGGLGVVLMFVTILASVTSLIIRYRRSHGEERQQLKWVTAAAAVFLVIFMFPLHEFASEDASFASLLVGLLIVASAVAIAMLRYRLYDIDVVINRALVYGALTATLAAVYLGAVLVLQLAMDSFTKGSALPVAISTLAVAALFRPVRARIQAGVDRRFFRRKYDAVRTLESFGARLRDEVDLAALQSDLRAVVADTMQPTHVSLWLRPTGGVR